MQVCSGDIRGQHAYARSVGGATPAGTYKRRSGTNMAIWVLAVADEVSGGKHECTVGVLSEG